MRYYFILLFFISFVANTKEQSIAIFDTGFCRTPLSHQKIKLQIPFNDRMDCTWMNGNNPRLHGQWVLSKLIELTPQLKEEVNVFLYKVFNERGALTDDLIKKAFRDAKKRGVKFILFAGGKPEIKNIELEPEHFMIVSAGQTGRGINKSTRLWPQNFYDREKMLVASFYQQAGKNSFFLPGGLLNLPETDYFFLEPDDQKGYLKGTSLAATKLAAKVLNLCLSFQGKDEKRHDIKECLDGIRKKMKIDGKERFYFE